MAKLKLLKPCNIFTKDVELQIDDGAYADVLEVRVLHGIRDDGHLERVARRVAHRQTDTVDGDRAFVDGEIAVASHRQVFFVLKGEVGGAVGVVHGDDLRIDLHQLLDFFHGRRAFAFLEHLPEEDPGEQESDKGRCRNDTENDIQGHQFYVLTHVQAVA